MAKRQARGDTYPLDKARGRLAKLWFIGAGLIFLILIGQSFGTIYEGHVKEVWNWALPALIPTLSLIITVLGSAALVSSENRDNRLMIHRRFLSVSFWLSTAYLLLILATILVQPFVVAIHADASFGPVDALKLSHLWLAPFQGLVVSALGVLFFSKKENAGQASCPTDTQE